MTLGHTVSGISDLSMESKHKKIARRKDITCQHQVAQLNDQSYVRGPNNNNNNVQKTSSTHPTWKQLCIC